MTLTFLPIVEHELRTAARRRSTFLMRGICAAVALFGTVFLIITDPVGVVSASSGSTIFRAASVFAAGMCCLIPLVLGSDVISQERRQGTLGLLILTGLKGYDIVIGKLIGVSLNAFYCLLAVLPALTLPFFFGGIGPGEFFRMCLALINLMFFSFVVSLAASCVCKSARASFAVSVIALLFCYIGIPLLHLSISPAEAMYLAFEKTYVIAPSHFWCSLVFSAIGGCALIGIASHQLLQTFGRERRREQASRSRSISLRDRTLLDHSPIQWLLMDSGLWTASVWVLSIVLVVALAFAAVLPQRSPLAAVVGWPIAGALVAFKLLFAQQSSRFFAEARRSGELETLCATPIQTAQFIRDQWVALKNVFLAPAILLLLFYFIALHTDAFAPILALQARTSFVGLNVPLLSLYLVVLFVFDLVAIGWFSMWLGFSLPKPQYAVVLTLLIGIVVPAVIIIFPHPLITLTMLVIGRARLRQYFRTGQFVPVQI